MLMLKHECTTPATKGATCFYVKLVNYQTICNKFQCLQYGLLHNCYQTWRRNVIIPQFSCRVCDTSTCNAAEACAESECGTGFIVHMRPSLAIEKNAKGLCDITPHLESPRFCF